MSDPPPPPRVHVTLPTGAVVEARLLAWVQAADGTWQARVMVQAPRSAVGQIPGEDYRRVEREEAAPRLVFQPLRHDTPGARALELHVAGCWGATGRLTEATEVEARFFLDKGWAVRCDACKPLPPAP